MVPLCWSESPLLSKGQFPLRPAVSHFTVRAATCVGLRRFAVSWQLGSSVPYVDRYAASACHLNIFTGQQGARSSTRECLQGLTSNHDINEQQLSRVQTTESKVFRRCPVYSMCQAAAGVRFQPGRETHFGVGKVGLDDGKRRFDLPTNSRSKTLPTTSTTC
jgi:hypothetical protein